MYLVTEGTAVSSAMSVRFGFWMPSGSMLNLYAVWVYQHQFPSVFTALGNLTKGYSNPTSLHSSAALEDNHVFTDYRATGN
jgi:hypothetical protein